VPESAGFAELGKQTIRYLNHNSFPYFIHFNMFGSVQPGEEETGMRQVAPSI